MSFILYILYLFSSKINKELYNNKVSIILFNINTIILKLSLKIIYYIIKVFKDILIYLSSYIFLKFSLYYSYRINTILLFLN
jgi:hypothetical protein